MAIGGKWRLVILAVVVLALVVVAVVVKYPRTKRAQTAAAAATANATGGTTANADQVKAMESWGLQPSDVPAGTQLQQGAGELRDYAAAEGNTQAAKQLADTGRVDGFSQVWIQKTAEYQYRVYFDLYQTSSQAMGILNRPLNLSGAASLQTLPDPKLGDASRMFGTPNGGLGGRDTWIVQWVRGRTVFYVDGGAPAGKLTQNDILGIARTIDGRAKQTPIK